MTKTLHYIARIAIWPGDTTEKLLNDPDCMQHGVAAWLTISIIYGLVAFAGGLNGLGPVVEPFSPIHSKEYYLLPVDGSSDTADLHFELCGACWIHPAIEQNGRRKRGL